MRQGALGHFQGQTLGGQIEGVKRALGTRREVRGVDLRRCDVDRQTQRRKPLTLSFEDLPCGAVERQSPTSSDRHEGSIIGTNWMGRRGPVRQKW